MELDSGDVVERYEVISFLGEGAMGRVYKVRHRTLNAVYALKLLKTESKAIRKRLLIEGQVQAALRHRNVVSVTDTVTIDGHPGLVLEFVDGPDLDEFIREHAPLPLSELHDIGRDIIRGVRAAHRNGHLHRDLKPQNIMIIQEDGDWVPKVADFGLAKVLNPNELGFSGTRTGGLMGTPAYMSPEQARDSKNVDQRTDVFALGCVLYELATGTQAFRAPDMLTTLARIAAGAFTPPDALRPDLSAPLVNAIRAALIVDREQRVPDCDTLLDIWLGNSSFEIPNQDPKGTLAALVADVDTEESKDPTVSTIAPSAFDGTPDTAPASRSSALTWLLPVGGAAALMAALLLLGVGGFGVWWFQRPHTVDLKPLDPRERIQPVDPPPAMQPSVPQPTEPTPTAPVVRPTPRPSPAPVRPSPPPQAQPDRPSPVGSGLRYGSLAMSPDSDRMSGVWAFADGEMWPVGKPMPEGAYRLMVRFSPGTDIVDVQTTVIVTPGASKSIRCTKLGFCSVVK